MPDNIGTLIIAPIVPNSTSDTYPTHFDHFGAGGYRCVSGILDRDSIPIDRQKVGMAVYVEETDTIYNLSSISSDLTDNNWGLFQRGYQGSPGPQGVVGSTGPQGPTGIDIIIDILYTDLKALSESNAGVGVMIVGQQYRITDYQTTFPYAWTSDGVIEPLIVTAATSNNLYLNAISEAYPTDIIRYDLGSNLITYREDTIRDKSAYFDWRHTYTGVAYNDGLGNFTNLDPVVGFEDSWEWRYWCPETSKNVHIGKTVTLGFPAPVMSLGDADKVIIGDAPDPIKFGLDAYDVVIGSCAGGTFYGAVESLQMGSIQNVIVRGEARQVNILEGADGLVVDGNIYNSTFFASSVYFTGSVTRCTVLPSAAGQYDGDRVDELIGLLGISTTFNTLDGQTVTVINGLITNIQPTI